MSTPAITKDIDDNVFFEFHPVVQRKLRHKHHRFGVVSVHMKYWRLNHFGHFRAVVRRSRICWITHRVTNLVVDNDVNGTTGIEATRLRHLKGFHHHALPGKGSVTVHINRKNLFALCILPSVHSCTNRTNDNRRGYFQVRRVETKRQVHLSSRRHQVR